MDCKYIIDRTQSDKIIVKTENDDIEMIIPDDMNVVDCCITRVEHLTNAENGDTVNKYVQFFDINGMTSQIVFDDSDIDEQNPIKTGELECDVDYIFIKTVSEETDEIVPVYIKLNEA